MKVMTVGDGDEQLLGQNYGLDPQYAQVNGWFTINNREGKMSFSSNLAGSLNSFRVYF